MKIDRYYTDEFFNYKDGFAAGVLDLLLFLTSNIDCTNRSLEDDWWSYGYADAFFHYYTLLVEQGDFDLADVFNDLNSLYFDRILDNNIRNKDNYPAFILKLDKR